MLKRLVFLASLTAVSQLHAAHVVLNEIMYHPPGDRDALQYIELLNPTAGEVDLSNWQLAGGVKFIFPQKTKLAPGGFIVVARDRAEFQRAYGNTVPVAGNFTGKLSHKGEKLQLVDASGGLVEKLHYLDQAPWPLGPDGYGSSLERICPDLAADEPRNWASSPPAPALRPAGSPGEPNAFASAKPPPLIENVRWDRLASPRAPLEVSAEVRSASALDKVVLEYRTVRPSKGAPALATAEVPMSRVSGTNGSVRYQAQIPAQAPETLIRFTISATDKQNATRIEPGASEPRPAFSAYVRDKIERGNIPAITVINSEPVRGGGNNKMAPPRKDNKGGGKTAVVYVPPQGEVQLFDFVQVRRRAGGLKVHGFRDQPIDEMTSFNLIFEGPPRWVLSEHLSYELYRKAGMKIEKSGYARLTVDGRALGYYLLVEQPNKSFLARTGRDDSGNLYKLRWFGRGVVDQHEKKTNPETGHDDIVSLIDNLKKKTGAAQWAYIQEQFDVEAFANYYAVNMCIQNWDGFFNNHFVYHDLKPGGKWDILPWDEDKTWGEYDGCPPDYSWYDMPLTMGSSNDRTQRGNSWFGGGGPFGGSGWWRPPGFLSGPLLSNPQFRQKFEARLRELCNSVFTPEKFGPVVQELQTRLRPEVEVKARAAGRDPSADLRTFDSDIASYHRQLVNRRKFILNALGK